MKKNGIFKGIKKHIVILILLSGILSFFSLQIAVYISYAIDGILFEQTDKIPTYLIPILEMGKIKGLMVLSGIIVVINLIVALGSYIRQRITTGFTLKISSNLKKMLYAHILNLEYESYQSYSKVEMLQRANEDAQDYANFYKNQFNLILDIISLSFLSISANSASTVSFTLKISSDNTPPMGAVSFCKEPRISVPISNLSPLTFKPSTTADLIALARFCVLMGIS